MNVDIKKRTDDFCFYSGLAVLVIGILILIFFRKLHWTVDDIQIPCVMHYLTGFYCPGCGGTRAVQAMLRGQWVKSLLYHPVVLPGALLYLWFMISQSIQRVSRGKIKTGMHFHNAYLWTMLVVILLQCIVKNILVLVYQADILLWI